MKVKTAKLEGPALDWAAAKAEGALAPLGNLYPVGKQLFIGVGGDLGPPGEWVVYSPSTDWYQYGLIIDREKIESYYSEPLEAWAAKHDGHLRYGPTPLIAAMRCLIASKLGDEVDVPDELVAHAHGHADASEDQVADDRQRSRA